MPNTDKIEWLPSDGVFQENKNSEYQYIDSRSQSVGKNLRAGILNSVYVPFICARDNNVIILLKSDNQANEIWDCMFIKVAIIKGFLRITCWINYTRCRRSSAVTNLSLLFHIISWFIFLMSTKQSKLSFRVIVIYVLNLKQFLCIPTE